MIFRKNFKRVVEEKTGMKVAAFMQDAGINYSIVRLLDQGGLQVLTNSQLAKICDKLQMSPKELSCLWDESFFEDEAPKGKPITSAEELKEKLRADGVLKSDTEVKPEEMAEQIPSKPVETPKLVQKPEDVVNHPSHYTHGGIECIDIISNMTADKAGIEAFCVGNVVKYLYRYQQKGGVEDVKKAGWYLKKLVEVLKK